MNNPLHNQPSPTSLMVRYTVFTAFPSLFYAVQIEGVFFFCQLTEYMSEHRFHLKALEKSVTALKSF